MTIYFALACGITWLLVLPLVLSHQGVINLELSAHWHFLGGFGPILAAAFVARRTGIFRQWLAGLLRWRVGAGWLLLSAGSPFILFLVGFLVTFAAGGFHRRQRGFTYGGPTQCYLDCGIDAFRDRIRSR